MLGKVQKWGNSQGIRLSKKLLEVIHLNAGDEVELIAHEGTIIVTPVRRVRGRVSLESLVAEIPADYRAEEVDWGAEEGLEVW